LQSCHRARQSAAQPGGRIHRGKSVKTKIVTRDKTDLSHETAVISDHANIPVAGIDVQLR
jgi:hypothetical protein